jgi:hypothetical protein
VGFIAGHGNSEAISITSPGFTPLSQQNTTSPNVVSVESGYQDLSSTAAQSFSGSYPASQYWSSGISLFKASSTGAPQPTTSVLIPATGATLSGTATLDASASNATSVEFWLFGGSYGYSGKMIGTATQTLYGWLYFWNTTTVPNGSYVLLSVAFNSSGHAFSPNVNITVTN